ncbi:hypothetical protein LZ30DRAFT_49137 [Colletotrichum cereale]|nr:hypothetical protein LZ30DRAFT_49137 [Colletotrichum cereale]
MHHDAFADPPPLPVGRVCLTSNSCRFSLLFVSFQPICCRPNSSHVRCWKQSDPSSGSSHQEPQMWSVYPKNNAVSALLALPFLEENAPSSYDAGSVGNAFEDESVKNKTKEKRMGGKKRKENGLVSTLARITCRRKEPTVSRRNSSEFSLSM